jgi:hypothetical protein
MRICSKCYLIFLLIVSSVMLTAQRPQENMVPLKNWATPLYWHPNQAEREAAVKPAPQLQYSTNGVSTEALSRDHALPFGRHARRRCWIQRRHSFFRAVHNIRANRDISRAVFQRGCRQHRACSLRRDSFPGRGLLVERHRGPPMRRAWSTISQSGRPALHNRRSRL